jgi:uncharacterized BrkB/YihY/UPF0761 family membrane protein
MKTLIFLFGLFLFFGSTLGCVISIYSYLQRVKKENTSLQELLIVLNILGVFIGACILRGYIK